MFRCGQCAGGGGGLPKLQNCRCGTQDGHSVSSTFCTMGIAAPWDQRFCTLQPCSALVPNMPLTAACPTIPRRVICNGGCPLAARSMLL